MQELKQAHKALSNLAIHPSISAKEHAAAVHKRLQVYYQLSDEEIV